MTSAPELCVDALGLKCPLPVLMARRALVRSPAGATIAVQADDPLAAIDLPAFCQAEGHDLLAMETATRDKIFRIRKAGRSRDERV